MSHFLYLRGNPGVGKITVARILEKDLGWRLFWFHDLKNAVQDIVGDPNIPRLMDAVTGPVLHHLLAADQNVIYVRPSADRRTVDGVRRIIDEYPVYVFHQIQLTAAPEVLVQRVLTRKDPYRISDKDTLLDRLAKRPSAELEGEISVPTDDLLPSEVAKAVIQQLRLAD